MEQENTKPEEEKPKDLPSEKKSEKRRWLIIVLIILAVILVGLIIYLLVGKSNAKTVTTVSPTPTVTIAATRPSTKTPAKTATKPATPEPTQAQSAESSEEAAVNGSKTVAQNFMTARFHRDLNEAKPYVTEDFLSKYDQSAFAGASSPGVGSFDIGNVTIVESGKKYNVSVTVHWILGGEESGTTVWTLNVVKQDNKYLVDDYIAPM